jgi:hypothetical protein
MSSCSVTDSVYTDTLYTVSEKHWGVLYGGLVALKYLLPLNIFLFFSHYPDKIFQIFKECLVHSNDDVSGAAANVLYSFSLGVKKNLTVLTMDPQKKIRITEFREKLLELISVYLISVIEDLRISINSLDALSCRCYSLCNGWSSCCLLLFYCIPTLSSSAIPSCSALSSSSSTSSSIASSTALLPHYQLSSQTNMDSTNNNDIGNHNNNSKANNGDRKKCKNNLNIINNSAQKENTTILTSEIILDVTVVLTSALSDVLLKLLLFCRRSQVRCLTALKPGKKSYFTFIFTFLFTFILFSSLISLFFSFLVLLKFRKAFLFDSIEIEVWYIHIVNSSSEIYFMLFYFFWIVFC